MEVDAYFKGKGKGKTWGKKGKGKGFKGKGKEKGIPARREYMKGLGKYGKGPQFSGEGAEAKGQEKGKQGIKGKGKAHTAQPWTSWKGSGWKGEPWWTSVRYCTLCGRTGHDANFCWNSTVAGIDEEEAWYDEEADEEPWWWPEEGTWYEDSGGHGEEWQIKDWTSSTWNLHRNRSHGLHHQRHQQKQSALQDNQHQAQEFQRLQHVHQEERRR